MESVSVTLPDDKNKICRVCLSINEENVFENHLVFEGEPTDFYRIIEAFNVDFSQDEIMPNRICDECAEECQKFFNFRAKIVESEMILSAVYLVENDPEKVPESEVNKSDTEVEEQEVISVIVSNEEECEEDGQERILHFTEKSEDDESDVKEENKVIENLVEFEIDEKMDIDDMPIDMDPSNAAACLICLREYECQFDYSLHFVQHILSTNKEISEHLIFCKVCGQVFSSKEECSEHLETKHPDVELNENWPCDHCEQITFTNESDLLVHERLSHPLKSEEGTLFKCAFCPETRLLAESLIDHAFIHLSKKHNCLVCKNMYITPHALYKHVLEHPKYRYECSICEKVMTAYGTLSRHIRDVHEKPVIWKCKYAGCTKTFRSKNALRRHGLSHDSESNVYSCKLCPYTSKLLASLGRHSRVHTNDRPYKCTFKDCDKSFKTQSHLSEHSRSHLNIKSFECDICYQLFSKGYALKIHRMIHTGEKPFKCEKCFTNFRKKHHLELHLRNKH